MSFISVHHEAQMTERFIPPPPEPGTYYRTFRSRLKATEQLQFLARYLAHVHWLAEGWIGLPDKLSGTLKRVYEDAAAQAVRECSEADRVVGMHRAEQHGIDIFPELERKLRSCDTTQERREYLISEFVRRCVEVRQAHMKDGCSRTPAEIREFERQERELEQQELDELSDV